jgi:hypothetical protein
MTRQNDAGIAMALDAHRASAQHLDAEQLFAIVTYNGPGGARVRTGYNPGAQIG